MACLPQAYRQQELRKHKILGYFKSCVESTLSERRKEEMKLLCVISSSLWWILSNPTTFLWILHFLKNDFDGANADRTSEQGYKREDELWETAPGPENAPQSPPTPQMPDAQLL